MFTLHDLVRHSIAAFPEKAAFSMTESGVVCETLTYAEVGKRIKKVQHLLHEAGLVPGDKVALLSSNSPNWGVAYLAITSAGMVVVPILPDFSPSELTHIISHSEAKGLVVSDKLFSKLSKKTVDNFDIVIRTQNLRVIHGARVSLAEQDSVRRGEEIPPTHRASGPRRAPRPDDLAAIIYTSGTTSTPKGVMLTHSALCAQVDLSASIFPVIDGDVFLSVLPLAHTYECSIGMIYPFARGAEVVYLDRPPTATVLLPVLATVRPTVMLIVPLIIEKIYRGQVLSRFTANKFIKFLYRLAPIRKLLHRMAGRKLKGVFGGRLRFLGIGGAKLDGDTERFLLEAKFPYAIGYGLTETAPLLAGAAPSQVRLGSTGPAAPGVELKVENVDPKTGQGEILARTPSAMLGYYKNPAATKEVFTPDGWLKTGDLGCFSPDGWLYIKGRLKNMIVGPGGENIYPEDIESVLNSHVFINEAVVTQRGGRLVALVNFNKEALEARFTGWQRDFDKWKEGVARDITNWVNERVSKTSRVSEIVEEDKEFIKTPTHKIRRFLYTRRTQNPKNQK